MGLLSEIKGPRDLDALSADQLATLCREIREHLVNSVAKTGGHLGPNLGIVETTVAIHRVFDSPRDPIIFDTGHQSDVHKLLPGRQDFSRLRQKDGVAGYPQRSESIHDVVESSHASSSLSWADGIAKAFRATNQDDRYVVAVVGDGALTGGMTWEALNNITDDNDRKLVIVVNDNGRSYAPTIGGLARYLNEIRTEGFYRKAYRFSRKLFEKFGLVGRLIYSSARGAGTGLMGAMAPKGMFPNLDIKYIGPIDGHDIQAMETALRQAKKYAYPVIVHAI
ncbi:MAG: hypothetical protein RLZZ400_159, partial [Actinomycetota bacterium]